MKFTGSITALITPFKFDKVDYNAFGKLLNWQIAEGTNGFVPCGTTGESPTLTHAEHDQVIEFCVKETGGRLPVIAGTGSNSTAEAIAMSRHAEKIGADAVLVVAPYYNKPTQEGLYQHYKAINDALGIPIIVYNIPGRSVVDIKDETLFRLLELKNIKGVKDATGSVGRAKALLARVGDDFSYIGGDDGIALDFNREGASGTMSVASNIVPKLVSQMQAFSAAGKHDEAMAIQQKLELLYNALFCETSPGPVKYAAKLMGICSGELRLPLVEINNESKKTVETALGQLNLTVKGRP